MEQKLLEYKGNMKGAAAAKKPARPKIPMSQLAAQLEAREVNAATLDKKTGTEAIMYFRSHGYSTEEIGTIFNLSPRTVQRRVQKAKTENFIEFGIGFQKDFMQDIMNSTGAQRQRLLRLSHDESLAPCNRAKIIIMLNKLDLDRMTLLEKLGYLSKENAAIINGIDAGEYVSRNSAEWRLLQALAESGTEGQMKMVNLLIKMNNENIKREEDLYS
jgi:hypothetical protein